MNDIVRTLVVAVMITGLVGFILHAFLYWLLRRHRVGVWEQLGRPGFLEFGFGSFKLLRFLWRRDYDLVVDLRTRRLAHFLRHYMMVYTVLFIVTAIVILIGGFVAMTTRS